ncbi:MAG: YceD family protein [Gammaproteobacteria bacterium]|jgi:uncharacterized protein|nr:YceD family protein [Gammaproteobacteria bacterium]MDP6732310.1 YceD family protein [Gammaproteobacteria bacterium]|tara:strand:+ start:691 stop:1218 length:528 start_codon:yes stop_codon:yes gene_type:complete
MADGPVPAYVDTRKVFLQEAAIEGTVPLERLPRFREILATESAHVQIELRFSTNESNERLITGKLSAQAHVTCQRCLEPIAIELADEINLALLVSEELSSELDPALEPWICADIKLELAGLVEEQLMLCMPIVNYHPGNDCLDKLDYQIAGDDSQGERQAEEREGPFSVLKQLKE